MNEGRAMAKGRMISQTIGSSRKFHKLHGLAGELGDLAQALYPLLVVNADDPDAGVSRVAAHGGGLRPGAQRDA